MFLSTINNFLSFIPTLNMLMRFIQSTVKFFGVLSFGNLVESTLIKIYRKEDEMKKLLLFALPLALVFGSCSTSKVTTSWNQSKQTPAHFQKILVVGLFDNKNRDLRQ